MKKAWSEWLGNPDMFRRFLFVCIVRSCDPSQSDTKRRRCDYNPTVIITGVPCVFQVSVFLEFGGFLFCFFTDSVFFGVRVRCRTKNLGLSGLMLKEIEQRHEMSQPRRNRSVIRMLTGKTHPYQ